MNFNTSIFPFVWRLLTFRATREEMLNVGYGHLFFGLLSTWVVGMGRSWDDSKASLLQHLGVGSVVYVFILSLILWGTIAPLVRIKISYFQVLTFVCLVAPPGILYAIPVEMFVAPGTARALNVMLLCVVASWRVALLARYLYKGVGLRVGEIWVATLLPLSTIITPIAVFGLMNDIMSAMSGLRGSDAPPEPARQILYLLGMAAGLAWLPLVAAHLNLSQKRYYEKKAEAQSGIASDTSN